MPSDFLKSPVLPGTPIPHHEHKRLVTVLVIVIIVAVVVGIMLWWGNSATQTYTPIPVTNNQRPTNAQIVTQLGEIAQASEPSVTTNIITQLKKPKSGLTNTQKAAIVKQLSEF